MPSIMAFFKRKEKAPAEVQRLDWKLLERGAVALYHKSSVLSADVGWFRQQKYAIHEMNAASGRTPTDFTPRRSACSGFRRTTGRISRRGSTASRSFRCRTRAEWCWCSGGTTCSRARSRQLAQTILDSIETTSRRFLLTGRRLLALVQSDDPRIRFERVGAMPVTWNPRSGWTPIAASVAPE